MSNVGLRFQDIDDRTEELRKLSEQHPDLWRDFLNKYELSLLYHENALEGIVVTHAELNSALKGRPIAIDTYHAIRNLKRACNHVRREAATTAGPVDTTFVSKVHGMLCEGAEQGDVFRRIIPLHRTYFHEIAHPDVIEARFRRLLDWSVAADPSDEDVVRFAAHFHHEFMSIFPFAEHTGKVGRLLVNYVLVRHGYMPVVFHASERQRYYDVLRHGPKDMEGFLSEMMANSIENGRSFIAKELAEREKAAARKLA